MANSHALPLAVAQVKYWAWWLVTKLFLGVIYVAIISEGLRYLVPAMGMKLYQLPLLGSLKNYTGTYKLDLAPFLAVFMAFAVWYLWEQILVLWLSSQRTIEESPWNPENHGTLLIILGSVILGADALLFYVGMARKGWGGSVFFFTALLVTVAYLAVLIFVSFVSVNLRQDISTLKGKDKNHDSQHVAQSRASQLTAPAVRMRREAAGIGNGATGE